MKIAKWANNNACSTSNNNKNNNNNSFVSSQMLKNEKFVCRSVYHFFPWKKVVMIQIRICMKLSL